MGRDERFKVSKLMAYILRHSPWEFGLKPDEEGFVKIEDLVNTVKKVYPWVTEEFIREIVEKDSKGRYEIRGDKIRARYGHSYPVVLKYDEDRESKVLYHGTIRENLKGILKEGLKPMKRQYVHLSLSYEDAYYTGKRHGRDVVVLLIDAECLRRKGYKIFKGREKSKDRKVCPYRLYF